MSTNTPAQQTEHSGAIGLTLKRLLRIVIYVLFMAALLFVSSGRLDWVMAWVYLGTLGVFVTVSLLVVLAKTPDLVDERAEVPEDAKAWDRKLTTYLIPFTLLVPPLVAGLDMRFGWSPPIPLIIQLIALAVYVLGYSLSIWASAANKFYSRVVRIQKDRGHVAISDGPYQYVRHPGYVGVALTLVTLPIMLGSWWTLIPNGLSILILIARTALEDQTLQNELDGYREYAWRVRYRLLPGIW